VFVATDNGGAGRGFWGMSSSAEDVFQDDGDCVVAHDVLSTPSGLPPWWRDIMELVGKGRWKSPSPPLRSVARPDKVRQKRASVGGWVPNSWLCRQRKASCYSPKACP